ncbi:MAG: hypothetical protein Q7S28_01095 [bacterium]|nr:hypothetical protein [bacterium]
MWTKKKLLVFLIILIIAVFLRTYHFTSLPPGLYPDEAMNGNNALESLHTGDSSVFYPENNGREGLFINIQATALKLWGGREPWMLRSPAPLFGILTVLGVGLLAIEFFGIETGILAAILLATNFWHINFSRIGFRAIMAPFFIVWGLYFLYKGFKAASKHRVKTSFAWTALASVIYGLGFYSYIAYRVTPLMVLIIAGYYWWKSRREGWQKLFIKNAALCAVLVTLTVAPLLYYFGTHPGSFFGRTSDVSVFASQSPVKDISLNLAKTFGMFVYHGDWNWRHNFAGAPELYWPVSILFLVGIAVAARRVWRGAKSSNGFIAIGRMPENAFLHRVLFGWSAIALLPVVISNEGIPHALRAILLIPPAIIFAAIGGVWLFHKLFDHAGHRFAYALAAILILATTANAYYMYFIAWGKSPNVQNAFAADYAALGRELNALPADIDKYVVVNAGGVLERGIPVPAQTVMFITDTWLPERQAEKRIHYVRPEAVNTIPKDALVFYIN